MHLLAQFSPSHLFLVGLLATSVLILYQTHRRWQRTAGARPANKFTEAREQFQRPHPAHAPAEARQWQVEMHEYAREVTARIDSKMVALEHLMRAAHHETLRLEATLAQARAAGLAPDTGPALAAVEFTPISQAQVLQDAARATSRGASHAPVPKPHLERPYARIYALADAGLPAPQIAAETSLPLGEVELILGLRSRDAVSSG